MTAGLCLIFRNAAFWNRAEPFLLLAVTTGLMAVMRRSNLRAIVFGLIVGLAVGIKPHAGFYFIPLLAIAWQNGWRWRAAAIASATVVVVAIAPFPMFPQFSLANYWLALNIAAAYPGTERAYLHNAVWLTIILAPAIAPLLMTRKPGEHRRGRVETQSFVCLAAIIVAAVPLMLPASQMAAGQYHFLPLIPTVAFVAAQQAHALREVLWTPHVRSALAQGLRYTWLVSLVLAALARACALSDTFLHAQSSGLAQLRDLQQIIDRHRNETLLMGLGEDRHYFLTLKRPELVFNGMPPGIDAVAAMDFKGRGLPEPKLSALVKELGRRYRKPLLWLVPRNAMPFAMRTYYEPRTELFSDEFRSDFEDGFEQVGSTEFFDLYAAKTSVLGTD
jgi:hypothetical protein